jgi:hypothetical protein
LLVHANASSCIVQGLFLLSQRDQTIAASPDRR